jgi:hypothetical protein
MSAGLVELQVSSTRSCASKGAAREHLHQDRESGSDADHGGRSWSRQRRVQHNRHRAATMPVAWAVARAGEFGCVVAARPHRRIDAELMREAQR